ncbi:MBL fold metallo-hydrolase [Paenibacillus sp. ACRRX]|uniref:MBL fold metallo-hydrolase n=1 Tax=Paenibacillus sp. ACRRX TaxID=2918206 RepID=UPI001EF4E7FB|nr:MBL fold metallo-hydrolase [Paenibacillus sp. ACRRX]MCG7410143.1 MBL fold metallo-hydrolase [Paenibacillus sp. ACRRX]
MSESNLVGELAKQDYTSQTWAEGENWSITVWNEDGVNDASAIYQIRIPLPFSLRWVNAYAIYDQAEGWTLVDPGLRTAAAELAWEQIIVQMNLNQGGVACIVLTHYHPDHLGLAGWLQQRFQVPVLMSEIGWKHAQMLWGAGQTMTAEMQRLLQQHGVLQQVSELVGEHMDSFIPLVSPLPQVTLVGDGEIVRFGGREWQVIETHGHAPGHLSFYNEQCRVLLAGDHVLPQISPNVSYMPGSDPEPLHHFLLGLERLAQLDAVLVLPGHRHPFVYFHSRIEDLLGHHEQRLTELRAMLVTEQTAQELCSQLFGSIERLTIHQFRFAMGETLAHLTELQRRKQVTTRQVDKVTVWKATAPASD